MKAEAWHWFRGHLNLYTLGILGHPCSNEQDPDVGKLPLSVYSCAATQVNVALNPYERKQIFSESAYTHRASERLQCSAMICYPTSKTSQHRFGMFWANPYEVRA